MFRFLSRVLGRWLPVFSVLCVLMLAFLAAPLVASAQTAAAPSTTVDLRPLLGNDAVWQAIAGIVTIAVGLLLKRVSSILKIQIDDRVRGYIDGIAMKGLALAQVKAGALPLKVEVHSPFVADAANYVVAHAPDGLKWFGIDPQSDQVKHMVAARAQQLVNGLGPPMVAAPAPAPAPAAQ